MDYYYPVQEAPAAVGNVTTGVDVFRLLPLSQTSDGAENLLINFTLLLESNVSGVNVSDVNSTAAAAATDGRRFWNFYRMAQLVTGLVCYPIICFFGLVGNIFILIVLSQKNMHSSTNVYLTALATSDVIKLTNDVLYFITVLLYKTNYMAGNRAYGYLYPYAHFVFNMSACVSSWLTVSVAVERYILVCHATRAKVLCTVGRARVISGLVYCLMMTCTLPSALRYRTIVDRSRNVTRLDVNVTELWQNAVFVETYNWLQNLLRSIIPLFILIIMNAFIINSLRKTRANKKMASRNRITVMLIIVIIFFILCITPDAIMSFRCFGYHEAKNYLIKGVREITDMMLAVNAAINFFLYMVFNRIFREQFIALFCSRCRRSQQPNAVANDRQYKRLADSHPNTVTVNGATTQKSTSAQSVV